jgi:Family of unknown function (DUF6493)
MSALQGRLEAAIAAQDAQAVVRLLRGVTEQERRLCNKAIQQRVAVLWDSAEHPALAVAALGLAQSAAQAAHVIRHLDVSDTAAVACEALAERRPRWLADFSCRILRPGWVLNGGWHLTRALIRDGLVPAPRTLDYLPLALGGTPDDPPLHQALLDDPPLLEDEIFQFAAEGAGDWMRSADGYVETVRRLPFAMCDEGHLDRGRVLDSCLGALLSDLPPSQLGWYVGFHRELAPSLDEIADRSATYLRVLATEAGSAVNLAQRALKPLVRAGRLDPAALLEACAAVLHRAEKKHVLAQLKLLEITARRHPEFSSQVSEAAAAALTHKHADVAEKALALIEEHKHRLGDTARRQIAEAAGDIAPSLHLAAETVLSLPIVQPGPQEPVTPAPGAAAPGRVADLHELAETAAAIVFDPWDPALVEQLLDGLGRFCGDYDAFAAALAPVTARVAGGEDVPQLRTLSWLLRADEAAEDLRRGFRAGHGVALEPFWDNHRSSGASPGALLGIRLHEIYGRFWRGEPAPLLAFPDTGTGHVDPGRLVAELAQLETSGRKPWPADFLQALLRLPRQVGSAPRQAAAALTSPAGRLLEATIGAGGLPDPDIRVTYDGTASAVALAAAPGMTQWGKHLTRIWDLPDPINTVGAAWYREAAQLRVWAWALPSHRDVTVSHALPVLNGIVYPERIYGPVAEFIALLPDLGGPAGPATNIALCYALAAHQPEHRASGVDALIGFARTGELDGAAFGQTLATLARDGPVMLGRICAGLGLAGDSGAHSLVWHAARAALPALLASGTRDCHRLLAVAADCAARLGARDKIEGLGAAAAGTRSNRLTVEARRLQAALR